MEIGTQPSKATFLENALPVALLILALALRVWILPAADELRDPDEIGYVTSGLVLFEGMIPPERATPSGEQTWMGWMYVAARSGAEFLHLGHSSGLLRPLKAIDQALFKTYEDPGGLRTLLLWISIVVSLAAVYGAHKLGRRYGGFAGGLVIAGLVAALPLFVEFAGISKSCTDAWMFGILSVCFAAKLKGTKRVWVSGILLGLAVTSRIDMVMLGPLLWWMIWDNPGSEGFWKPALKVAALSVVTALITAPWVLTGFVGMVRSIFMTRAIGYADNPPVDTFKDLVWGQGFGPVLLVTIIGLALLPRETRGKRWALAVFAALLVSTMFGKSNQPMRYHGGPIITLMTLAAVAVGPLLQRLPKYAAAAVAVVVLALPLAQSVRTIKKAKSFYAPDGGTEWIEKNVPPGTIVYLRCTATVKALLPTQAAADANWGEIAGDQAWRTKVEDGLKRFSLPKGELPRAMTEDNLVMDRGFGRRWFILGGGKSQRSRYDLRVIAISRTSGWRGDRFVEDFKSSGGAVMWRTAGDSRPPAGLGEPTLKWVNERGYGTLVYLSPELREKLKIAAPQAAVLSSQ